MTPRRWVAAMLTTLLMLAAAACGSDSDDGSGPAPTPTTDFPTTQDTVEEGPTCDIGEQIDPDTGRCGDVQEDIMCDAGSVLNDEGTCVSDAVIIDSPACPEDSYEGAFGESDAEMLRLYVCMLPFLDNFLVEYYGVDESQFPNYMYLATGEEATACDTPLDDMAYAFCDADYTVYIGLEQLRELYIDQGDGGAVGGFIHEGGHAVQELMDVPPATTNARKIEDENQADCFLGAWFYDAEIKGIVEYPDDIQDMDALMAAIASAEGDPNRDHGTLDERTQSFLHGYNNGLLGCNQLTPYPIYVQN